MFMDVTKYQDEDVLEVTVTKDVTATHSHLKTDWRMIMLRLREACEDMQVLNILARNGRMMRSEGGFYRMKNALMEHLYREGKCIFTKASIQSLPCYRCWETGIDEDGEKCRKCGGSRIYRQHVLYCMTFLVEGRRFRWHIPKAVVSWEIRLNEEGSEPYQEGLGEIPEYDEGQIRRLLVRCWVRCKANGVKGLPKFRIGWRDLWRLL